LASPHRPLRLATRLPMESYWYSREMRWQEGRGCPGPRVELTRFGGRFLV
jgi:hypothetical protein